MHCVFLCATNTPKRYCLAGNVSGSLASALVQRLPSSVDLWSAEWSFVSFTESLKIVVLADSIVTVMSNGVLFDSDVERQVQDTNRPAWRHDLAGQHRPGQVGTGQHWNGHVRAGSGRL